MPTVRQFLKKENHQIDLLVDNTETLLAMLERGELDFAIIEGVFDKEKYSHRLYKKESFLGICSRRHSFAGRTVSLEEVLQESLPKCYKRFRIYRPLFSQWISINI